MSNNIQDKIQEELKEARDACDTSGAGSAECAAAWDADRKSTRLNSSHSQQSRMPSSA